MKQRSIDYGEMAADVEFNAFWQACTNKVGKGDAYRAWSQTREVRPPVEEIIAAWGRYARTENYRQGFRQHPATWLRDLGWENVYESAPSSNAHRSYTPPPAVERTDPAVARDRLRILRGGQT